MAGVTLYSAIPPIEYIDSFSPLARCRRVSPSYSVPCRRLNSKNVEHRSSMPREQFSHRPHGMMNEPTTRSPGWTLVTPAPTSATIPEISCPRTPGNGNPTSPFITCRSV